MNRPLLVLLLVLGPVHAFAGPNYSIVSEPYFAGGLFTDPLIPKEGEDITITVRVPPGRERTGSRPGSWTPRTRRCSIRRSN
ncbi:MAG: hypothetical protein JXR94_14455 [Candidatus Hydrogenedentes bacterium]|nr:hypothetical protein [Candidatus Hydrogenedentota bacterium]